MSPPLPSTHCVIVDVAVIVYCLCSFFLSFCRPHPRALIGVLVTSHIITKKKEFIVCQLYGQQLCTWQSGLMEFLFFAFISIFKRKKIHIFYGKNCVGGANKLVFLRCELNKDFHCRYTIDPLNQTVNYCSNAHTHCRLYLRNSFNLECCVFIH